MLVGLASCSRSNVPTCKPHTLAEIQPGFSHLSNGLPMPIFFSPSLVPCVVVVRRCESKGDAGKWQFGACDTACKQGILQHVVIKWDVVRILCCVQCDLNNQQVELSTLDAFCKKHSITAWWAAHAIYWTHGLVSESMTWGSSQSVLGTALQD